MLASLTDTVSRTTAFQYLSSGSGELEKVTFSEGGSIRWGYGTFTYSGSKTFREVQNRYLAKASGAIETTYVLSHDPADSGRTLRAWTKLDDPSGLGQKTWFFNATGFAAGFVSSLEHRQSAGGTLLNRQDTTWAQDAAGNPYITAVLTTLDPGASYQKQSKMEQALDSYGNVLWSKIYDFGNLTTPARTTTNSYLTGSAYTSRYIFNRLVSTTVSDGTQSVTLFTNAYDTTYPTSVGTLREHDTTNYGTSLMYRGNLTQVTPLGQPTRTNIYDITGTMTSSNDGAGHTVAVSPDSGHNYAVPSVITPNNQSNLATSFSYNNFLGVTSVTAPNAAVATTSYGTDGRVSQTQSVHGAWTSYNYNNVPSTVTISTSSRFTKTTNDGLGRPIKVETGDSVTRALWTQSMTRVPARRRER